jgi:hypothetical protein
MDFNSAKAALESAFKLSYTSLYASSMSYLLSLSLKNSNILAFIVSDDASIP